MRIRIQVISSDAKKLLELNKRLSSIGAAAETAVPGLRQLVTTLRLLERSISPASTTQLAKLASALALIKASSSGKSLASLAVNLQALGKVNVAGLDKVALHLTALSASLGTLSTATTGLKSLNSAARSLTTFSKAAGGLSKSNLGPLTLQLTTLASASLANEKGLKTMAMALRALNATAKDSPQKFGELSRWLKIITTDLVILGREGKEATVVLNAVAGAARGTRGSALSGIAAGGSNVNKTINSVDTSLKNVGKTIIGNRRSITQWGKDIQWIGRQIEFNFTLPLLAAAALGTKFALDQEAALTRIRKVYGDGSQATSAYNEEIQRLDYAMELLSNHFGVNKAEVLSLAASWAAAGLEGGALAEAVRATMEAMIVGDFASQEEAFEALVTIMGSYGLQAHELRGQLAILNTIENETASNFADLAIVIQKAGGAAHTAGIDIRHLAAMATLLTPALGSAATAGNSLRSIISRLMSPTKEAEGILKDMGVNLQEFYQLSGQGRIELVAKEFDSLSDSQQAYSSAIIASRWQVSRFDVLMRGILDPLSDYNKSLEATADGQRNLTRYTTEIQTLLSSMPQRFKIATTQIQNSLASILLPLLPAIASVLELVANLANSFAELPIPTQQLIAMGLLFVMLIGPLTRLVGAFTMLGKILVGVGKLLLAPISLLRALGSGVVAVFTGIMSAAGSFIAGLAGVLAGPWGLLIAGLVAVIYVFRDQIGAVLRAILDGPIGGFIHAVGAMFTSVGRVIVESFNKLPIGVQNALLAVARVVKTAVLTIYEWLSYLNPFARHSPSLVDEVTAGVDIIAAKYESLAGIGWVFRQAAADLREFTAATEAARAADKGAKRAEQTGQILAVAPGAGPQVSALHGTLDSLSAQLPIIEAAIVSQTAAVVAAEAAYDDMARAVDQAEAVLDRMRDAADGIKADLDAAQAAVDYFANAGIEGMDAYDDAIFANEMEQKRLQLELLRTGDAAEEAAKIATDAYNAAQASLSAYQGEIETLMGTVNDLRAGGAGSEILAPYLDQIEALKRARDDAAMVADPGEFINPIAEQLEQLRREGEILKLEQELMFDPLLRQIDDLTDGLYELPFNEIVAGIIANQGEVDRLTTAYAEAQAQIEEQEAVVAALAETEDVLRGQYEDEQAALQELNEVYADYETQIRDVEQALADMAQVGLEAINAAKEALKDAEDGGGIPGEGADFEMPDDFNLEDQIQMDLESLIDSWEKEFGDFFKDLDIFGKIRDAWDVFKGWWSTNVTPIWSQFVDDIKVAWGDIGDWVIDLGLVDLFSGLLDDIGNKITEWASNDWAQKIFGFLNDAWLDMQIVWDKIVLAFQTGFKKITDALNNFGFTWAGLLTFIKFIGAAIVVAITVISGAWAFMWSVIAAVVGPIFDMLFTIIAGGLNIIAGIFTAIRGLVTGDWGLLWDGIKLIVEGAVQVVWGFLSGLYNINVAIFQAIKDFTEPLWQGIWGFLVGIWDAIYKAFESVMGFISALNQGVLDVIKGAWDLIWNDIKTIATVIWTAITLAAGLFFAQLKLAFDTGVALVVGAWNVILGIKQWVIDNVFNPIKDTAANFLYVGQNSLKRVFEIGVGAIDLAWQVLLNIWTWVTDKVINPIRSAFDTLFNAGNGIVNIFSNAVTAIGSAWDKVKEIAAVPVRFVIDTVVGGIASVWNTVADAVGLDDLKIHPPSSADLGLNAGGKVPGIGTGDTVAAMLTPGEFVLPTWLVDDIGLGTLESWRRRGLQTGGDPSRYAAGGYVRPPEDALDFARQQVGDPWVFSAVGPDAFDCSGLISAVTNYILGKHPPWSRRHSSGTVQSDPAFAPGVGEPGGFSVGRFIGSAGGLGHIAGTLAGVNIEATPPAVRVGPHARGAEWGGFPQQFHLPGYGGLSGDDKNLIQQIWGLKDLLSLPSFPGNFDKLVLEQVPELVTGSIEDMIRRVPGVGRMIDFGMDVADVVGGVVGDVTGFFGLGNGAFIKGGRGGVNTLIGEGPRNELVTPLPPGFSDFVMRRLMANETLHPMGGSPVGSTININGDLSFPNIHSGDDAAELIANLEALAG